MRSPNYVRGNNRQAAVIEDILNYIPYSVISQEPPLEKYFLKTIKGGKAKLSALCIRYQSKHTLSISSILSISADANSLPVVIYTQSSI